MGIKFALGAGQATFGSGDASSNMYDLPFSVYCSHLCCDGSQVVDFEFKGGIACSGREHGLYGAAERRVEERRHDSSMYCSKGIVMIFRWFGGKDNSSFAYFGYPHVHQDGDGGWGKLS